MHALQGQRRHEGRDVAAQQGDFLDEAGGDELVVFARHQEHGLDVRLQAVVHAGHLELIVEIGHRAQAAHDHAGADLAGEIDQQRVERLHLDLRCRCVTRSASISARTSATRSSSENSGPLPILLATPTTSRSSSRAARAMMSRWPLVHRIERAGIQADPALPGRLSHRWPPVRRPRAAFRPQRASLVGRAVFVLHVHHREHAGDALAGIQAEQRHAHGLAAGDAHLVGRHADQPAAIGHQHHVVARPHREGRGHRGAVARRRARCWRSPARPGR